MLTLGRHEGSMLVSMVGMQGLRSGRAADCSCIRMSIIEIDEIPGLSRPASCSYNPHTCFLMADTNDRSVLPAMPCGLDYVLEN